MIGDHNSRNDGEPAFPRRFSSETRPVSQGFGPRSGKDYFRYPAQEGMSLMDWFAGQVAAALVVGEDNFESHLVANISYDTAEALIKERNRRLKGS